MSPRGIPATLDLLPEQEQYVDQGCDLSPRCLACPLPWGCRYDNPMYYYSLKRRELHGRIVQAVRSERLKVAEAALRFGVSQRTVFRALASEHHTKGRAR